MKTVKFWLSIFALTCAVGCSSGKTGDPATLVTCVENAQMKTILVPALAQELTLRKKHALMQVIKQTKIAM